MALLDQIYSPLDLRRLPPEKLPELCRELRERIIEVVSKNGGHLAPALGVVELTVALHYVFQSPVDPIVWDVGDQAYAHKLLTGRREKFHTLRKAGGLSGFTCRTESEHDPFGAGHASTSISAALGLAEGKRLRGDAGKVVAVIGDGGLTGGLALEALNHAGSLGRDLVVVLNDNGMFIAPHVGAISRWLSQKLSGPSFNMLRRRIKGMLAAQPRLGEPMLQWLRRLIEGTKAFFTPGMLFEAFNFQYVGPVDGHDLTALVAILQNVRQLDGPVLVHVRTQKGRGLECAERDPSRFHGVGPFCPDTGEVLSASTSSPTYTDVFSRALVELGRREPRLVAITAAMPQGTGLQAFANEFPDRFYDVGIAEEHAVCFAAGLAAQGLRPVVAIYSTFLQRSYDQIIHDVCLQNLPVTFALDRGGIVGEDGSTHQGLFDLSYLANVPNMLVMAPADAGELVRMLHTAVNHHGPAALRYPRGRAYGQPGQTSAEPLPLGRGRIVRAEGERPQLAILTIGNMLEPALQAADLLAERGIQLMVADARFRKPLDERLIVHLARSCGRLLTAEENVLEGGFGQAVAALLHKKKIPARLRLVGVDDVFVPHGEPADLRRLLGLDAGGLVQAALELLEQQPVEQATCSSHA